MSDRKWLYILLGCIFLLATLAKCAEAQEWTPRKGDKITLVSSMTMVDCSGHAGEIFTNGQYATRCSDKYGFQMDWYKISNLQLTKRQLKKLSKAMKPTRTRSTGSSGSAGWSGATAYLIATQAQQTADRRHQETIRAINYQTIALRLAPGVLKSTPGVP